MEVNITMNGGSFGERNKRSKVYVYESVHQDGEWWTYFRIRF